MLMRQIDFDIPIDGSIAAVGHSQNALHLRERQLPAFGSSLAQ